MHYIVQLLRDPSAPDHTLQKVRNVLHPYGKVSSRMLGGAGDFPVPGGKNAFFSWTLPHWICFHVARGTWRWKQKSMKVLKPLEPIYPCIKSWKRVSISDSIYRVSSRTTCFLLFTFFSRLRAIFLRTAATIFWWWKLTKFAGVELNVIKAAIKMQMTERKETFAVTTSPYSNIKFTTVTDASNKG